MPNIEYGILKNATNTGGNDELLIKFSTPLNIYSNQPAYISDALSLRRQAVSRNVQRWEIEAALFPSSVDDTSANFLVHSVANSYVIPFYVRMPQVMRPASEMVPEVRTLTVSGARTAGGDTIDIDGLSPDVIYPGEFITFGNHPKVYMITESGTPGTPVTNVRFFPPLRENVPDNTPINFGAKVTLRVLYDADTQLGIRYTDGILSDPGVVRMVEKL